MSNRVFYPLESLSLGVYCTASGVPIHGVQSLTSNTSFNLEPVQELGQLEVYAQVENLPNIEITASKVLDGYLMLYHASTPSAVSKTLNGRTQTRCDAIMNIFSDTQDAASGIPVTEAYCSGLYLNSVGYNFNVNGNFTETVSLVGNDKSWRSSSFLLNGAGFNNTDTPASGVQRRQNIQMGATGSIWPTVIPGMTVANGSGTNIQSGTSFGVHMQSVDISANLNREDIFELGRRRPYFRYASFPVTVTCAISIVATQGDQINASSDSTNTTNDPIVIRLDDGAVFDLGKNNKCIGVSQAGGSTGGESQTVTYNFQNFNDLTVIDTFNDPAHLS